MLRGSLLVALACVALGSSIDATTFRLPLEHRVSSPLGEISGRRLALATNTKQPPLSIEFETFLDSTFLTKAYAGTPPQPLTFNLNLLSTDTVVLNHNMEGHAFYDHTKSSTYQSNGTQVHFLKGSAYETTGFVSRDTVTIGLNKTTPLVVNDLVVMEHVGPDSVLEIFPYDGEIGLGPGSSEITGAPSFMRSMINQGLLDRPQVGFSLGLHDGHVIFGGVDPTYQDHQFHFFNTQNDAWGVEINEVSVNGLKVAGASGYASVWAVPTIAGPIEAVDALAQAVGAKNRILPCEGPGTNITFQLSGDLNVTITKNEYAPEDWDGVCRFAFFGSKTKYWTLATPFLRSVYTVLDYGDAEGKERLGVTPIKRD